MLQIMDKMSKYPFGKFVIAGGIPMFMVYIYVLFCAGWIEQKFGVKWMLAGLYGLILIGVLFVVDFNKKLPPRITVPIGILSWAGVAVLGYIWYRFLSSMAGM